MKTISRQQLLDLAQLYFGGETPGVSCGSQVSLEEAYQSLRTAVSRRKGTNVPPEHVRFTSEPQDGDLDMSKLRYK